MIQKDLNMPENLLIKKPSAIFYRLCANDYAKFSNLLTNNIIAFKYCLSEPWQGGDDYFQGAKFF